MKFPRITSLVALCDVFATTSHDVDLLFYDQRSRGKMTFRHKDVMDAGQKVFTVPRHLTRRWWS